MAATADLRYTAEHEWVRDEGDGTVTVGITDYAQAALGDIVYVTMPQPGEGVTAGRPCGEVESTKSVSDIYAPVDGEVVARNEELDNAPETVNAEPYGGGWLLRIRLADPAQLAALLGPAEYARLTESA